MPSLSASSSFDPAAAFPARYRSLMTLLALTVLGSIISSVWLMPSRLERVALSIEHGDQAVVSGELVRAASVPADPGEVRALVDVALTLGSPETAASILQTFLTRQPTSVDALRLLLEVQRQRHLTREVALLDERVYALTGDIAALRDASDIYASRRMANERVNALRRLADANSATGPEIAELTHRSADAGDRAGALSLLMTWLASAQVPTPDLVGLAAGLSTTTGDATAIAERLGGLIGRSEQIGLLHVVIQTYAERGHRELSLVAARSLGTEMAARPDVALILAQLEALQGDFVSARARLDQLERTGTLLPAGLPMLAELSLQAGDLPRAVAIIGSFSVEQMPEGLPHRVVEAAFAADRSDLLARLPLEPIAESSPASGAAVAFARGERARAVALGQAALGPGADLADVGRSLGPVLRATGLERSAISRLAMAAREGAMEDDTLSLLIDLAEAPRADIPALLQVLRTQRDSSARAGVVWAVLAARHGRAAEVAAWIQAAGAHLPSQTLIDLLLIAVDRNGVSLAQAAAAGLVGRTDLPLGWTQGEIALTARAKESLTPARLRDGLDLIGAATIDIARDRLTGLLAGAPGFVQAAQSIRLPATHDAVSWLAQAIAAGGPPELMAARISLLAGIAPQQAIGALATRVASDPQRFGPLYVAALVSSGRKVEAQVAISSLLASVPPKQQDTALHETLARLPTGEALPILRIAAGTTRRDDWMAAYDEALTRAGLFDELRSVLRARAAAAGGDAARLQSLAARMVDLNDRIGAIGVLKAIALGKRPGAAEVEQLMFLWGPRADPDGIAWTRDQTLAARPADVPKWLQHLSYIGDPKVVVATVESRPAMLAGSADAVRTYGAALIAAQVQSKLDLRTIVALTSDPGVLLALAQLGLDTAQSRAAWEAASGAATARPRDPVVLLLASQAAAGIRRSDDAAALYTKLLGVGPQSVEVSVDAGDALIAAKRSTEGRRVLAAALARMPSAPTTIAEARLRARALLLLSRVGEATALLNDWAGHYPQHAGLRADLLQAALDKTGRAE